MAGVDVWDRFEIQLTGDLIKNLQDPEKAFQQELKAKNQDETGNFQSKRPRIDFMLDKMAGGEVKIIVTVFNPNSEMKTKETGQASSQTDDKPVDYSTTQTVSMKTEEMSMQTEKKEEKTQQQQTEQVSNNQEMSVQTDKKLEKTQHQQTEKKDEKTQQQQTERNLGKDQQQQTISKVFKDSQCQTFVKTFTSTECQTLSTPIVEQDCQTDSPKLAVTVSQTDMSMANQVSSECQATVETSCMVSQTDNDTSEQEIQATVEIADGLCQTSIPVSVKGSQTINYTKTMVAQTELSMLFPCDQECQVGAESSHQDCQTLVSLAFMEEFGVQASVENSEMSQQTDIHEVNARSIQTEYLGVYVETQTVPDVNNRECQTDDVIITEPNVDQPVANIGQEQIDESSAITAAPAAVEQIPPPPPNVDASLLEYPQVALAVPVGEMATQTDPVTIIIGDASFLVQKLKSATPPTPGRQIEINYGDKGEVTQNGGVGRSPGGRNTPRQYKAKRNSVPAYQSQADLPKIETLFPGPETTQVVGTRKPHMVQTLAGVGSVISCPFCDMTFLESPALYEHITYSHNEAAAQRHKKPRGREGKTTQARVRAGIGSPPYLIPQAVPVRPGSVDQVNQVAEAAVTESDGPPVLEPVYNFSESVQPPKKKRTYARQQEQVIQEPGLFEDLPTPARSYPRNRVRRSQEQEEEVQEATSSFFQPQIDAYEYECPHCPDKYGSASHLYTHLKRSHKDDMEKIKQETKPSDDAQGTEQQNNAGADDEQEEVLSNTGEVVSQPEDNEEETETGVIYNQNEEQELATEQGQTDALSPRKRKRKSGLPPSTKKPKISEDENADENEENAIAENEDINEGTFEESEVGTENDTAGEDELGEEGEELPNIASPKRIRGDIKKANAARGKKTEQKKVTATAKKTGSSNTDPSSRPRRSKRT